MKRQMLLMILLFATSSFLNPLNTDVSAQTPWQERPFANTFINNVTPTSQDRPQLRVQLGHASPILCVAFLYSSEGRFIVTGGQDSSVRLWDISTGLEIRRFVGHSAEIKSLAVSPDGRFILSSSRDGTARLWNTMTGDQVRSFEGHSDTVFSVDFSKDGQFVLTGSRDGTARVWNVDTGKEVKRLTAQSAVLAVAFSQSGNFAITGSGLIGSQDNVARLWNIRTGKEIRHFSGHSAGIHSVAFSPDEQFVLTGGWDGTAILWEATTGKAVQKFSDLGWINSVAFSPDGKHILTGSGLAGSKEKTAKLFDISSGNETRDFKGHDSGVTSTAFSRDGQFVLTGSWDNTARLWDVTTGRSVKTFVGHPSNVSAVTFSRDGRFILTGSSGSSDDSARLWDARTGKQVRRFSGHGVLSVAFSQDGQFVAAGRLDNIVRIWEAATGKEIQRLVGHTSGVSSVAFSPNGKQVLTGSWDKSACLWNVSTGKVIWCIPNNSVASAALSPDGKFILTGGWDQIVRLWCISTRTEVRRFVGHSSLIWSVAFSPDGKFALTTSGLVTQHDDTARLWNVSTGKEVQRFAGHSAAVTCADFFLGGTGGGKYILTGSNDGTVRLWEISTGKEVKQFKSASKLVYSIASSPKTGHFLTGNDDGVARLWDWREKEEVGQLISLGYYDWAVIDSKGRFDTNNLEGIKALRWIMPDDPFRPLPVEIFTRDYYQPSLLALILHRSPLREVRPVTLLNRAQPHVTITSVQGETCEKNTASIKVEIEQGELPIKTPTHDRPQLWRSGAYSLRLFRDGRLVGRCPNESTKQKTGRGPSNADAEMVEWRVANKIPLDPASGKPTCTFHNIQLPRIGFKGTPTFTAYAFNEDRVKSELSEPWKSNYCARPRVQRRAYVIRVGVDANQSGWNLDFASKSAEDMKQALHDKLARDYDVVDLSLLSTLKQDDFRTDSNLAKKDNIHAVLDLLAGRPVSETVRIEVDPANKLQKATPDDLVLLFIASHGYADPQGKFYLVPYDTGRPAGVTENVLNDCFYHPDESRTCKSATAFLDHSISSDDLESWWEDVDAGEMVMILDSCHSAAVSGKEFRPGPLGDRGFGQLSYDKGMLILTATQPDKTAVGALREGIQGTLLSSALIWLSATNPWQSLEEWLKDAERVVREQYRKLYPGVKEEDIQLPVLLDFANRQSP